MMFGWILTDRWSYREGGCRLMDPSQYRGRQAPYCSVLPHLILKAVSNVFFNRFSFNIVLGQGTICSVHSFIHSFIQQVLPREAVGWASGPALVTEQGVGVNSLSLPGEEGRKMEI